MATAKRDWQSQPNQQLITDLSDALVKGALPGELQGFDDGSRAEAAAFLAEAAAQRDPGKPSIRLESVGHGRRFMRVALINDDMPFLVDSVAGTMTAHELSIDRVLHPVISVRRDDEGRLIELLDDHSGARRESIIYMEVERADAKERRALVEELESVLADVRASVEDWPMMQRALKGDGDRMPDGEGAALLRWFLDAHLTQLGHEVRDRANVKRDALGMSRASGEEYLAPASLERAFRWFEEGGEAPLLIKSNLLATVHRRQPLDLVVLPIREGGKISALSIHAGLWTSTALATPPAKIPILRSRLSALLDKYGFDAAGHAGKALTHALAALPHDLLIAFSPADLENLALNFMSLADRPRPKLVTVTGALRRHVFAFVWLPRDELTTARRLTIGRMLAESADAKILNWGVALETGDLALIRYTLDIREGRVPDTEALDKRIAEMVRGWAPGIEETLAQHVEPGRATRLRLKYANEFPAYYRGRYTPAEAALDVLRLADLEDKNARGVRLHRGERSAANQLRLKIFNVGGTVPLSAAVPALENFGFRVIEEVPARLDEGLGSIHDFLLELDSGQSPDQLLARAEIIEPAIACVLSGEAENDAFNKLVVSNSMLPREAVLFRAWFRYLRQTGLSYGLQTVVDALRRAPAVARGIIELFDANHNPDNRVENAAERALTAIETGLGAVQAADDDRILRLIRGVVAATLRTNAFSPAAQEALAFKLDSAKVPGLPAPLPWREIWVYSPRVEGIHLRAGPVARGGLRWSDRRDDFRTEILGLMKAQRVKNAVIVPTGAKGGFYPKQLPNPQEDRDAWLAEGTESYRCFIRSLLSVTDNIVGGAVVHPEGVLAPDGDDPYFVVAADKGTATFSDIANAIALERGFWLGDAFASGGSQGYDHKAMGITAKGAWVSVQRHFAEQGVDVQTDTIRVVGCGDMSGDVFGNGLLLSKAVKLVAAFDHRHIFIDPDPDPASSWAERDRLFALPRSSWADYDTALMSAGGAVFPRTAKTVTLSAEAQTALGLTEAEFEPAALISAILKSQADLIWFGGIGTYVKSRTESNADVGDPANDSLRVNAEELRARAIGEGANLGVTQAARIAFSQLGGRINTDFIDNSAGVDCSDNEVNIKIALNREMNEGRLSFDDRNALLARMTDDVSELVLDDNRHQTLALSVAEASAVANLRSYVRLIETFEASGRLDRAVEGIAANDELLRRAQEHRGLTRPELSVLLATAKLALQDAIEATGLGQDPNLVPDLLAAFPSEMREKYRAAIEQHQLRGEIIATKIANRLVNRMGMIHPFELAEEEGAALGDIAAMFATVERLYNLRPLWDAIDDAAMPEAARIALLDAVALGIRAQMADLLRATDPGALPGMLVERLGPGIGRLDAQLEGLLEEEAQASSAALTRRLLDSGAPAELVKRVVRLYEMDGAVGLATLGTETGTDEVVLTRAFTGLGEALGLDWAQATAARLAPADPWERLLTAGLARDFQQMRLDFLARAGGKDPQAFTSEWLDRQAHRVAQFRDLIHRARATTTPNAAMLAQIAGQARVLLGR